MTSPSSAALLRSIAMRSDRSRVFQVVVAIATTHIALSLLLLPLSAAALGLIGLLLLAFVHRTLFVRLVPAIPSKAAPSLIDLARNQWLTQSLGTAAFCVASLFASLSYHGVLLRSCPAPAESCDPAAASEFSAAWAALLGLAVGADYAVGRGSAELPTAATTWPLVSLPPLLRLRAVLPGAAAQSARLCMQLALVLFLAAWLAPGVVRAVGATALASSHGCMPCRSLAAADSAADATGSVLPSVREVIGLLLVGGAFRASCALALAAVRVAYTRPLDFRAVGGALGAGGESALEAALSRGVHPLTQHLALLDAATLAQHEPARRHHLYALDRGGAWPRFLSLMLAPIDQMAAALEGARKRRGAPPAVLPKVALVPRRVLLKLQTAHAALVEEAARHAILRAAAPVMWAAEASSLLIAAASTEDSLGAVHLANSLPTCLTSLLRCMQALESYVSGGAPLGGGARARPPPNRSQQSIALRVALGPPAHTRAAGTQRAAALESALARAIYVLVHTYGKRTVLAADVPSELRPRLESICAELF